jgi:hypothetical protein
VGARAILRAGQEPRAEVEQEQEREHEGSNAEQLFEGAGHVLGFVRREDLEHLEPLVRAVDDAEQCERQERARKAELGRPAGLEQHHEPHGEERQPVEKVDVDDVPHEERGNNFHAHPPQKHHGDTENTENATKI